MDDIIIIRGAGDIATGIAHRLYKCGFRLIMLEIEKPLVVRRGAAFANAVIEGRTEVEGICAARAYRSDDISFIWNKNEIPVLCDSSCEILKQLKPMAVVDATLIKRNIGTNRNMAPITIGVGPGFEAGDDVDAVIETKRGHELGKVIYKGSAQPDTGIPGSIMGYSKERLLRAPKEGIIRNVLEIGSSVKTGETVAAIDDAPVKAPIDGILRGLIADNTKVHKGLKIGDIDPRGIKEYCFTISDKSRSVAGGVLEAVLCLKRVRMGA